MTLAQITDAYGPAALCRFTGLVVVFLILRLIRLPFAVAVRLLSAALGVVDRAVSTRLAMPAPPGRPTWSAT